MGESINLNSIEDDFFLRPYQEALLIHNQKKNEARANDNRVHVSDILYCPRKHVFDFVENVKPGPKSIYFFTIGEAIHNWIQDMMVEAYPGTYTKEMTLDIPEAHLIAHPDLYDKQLDRVIELKTTKETSITEPYESHVRQLKTYLALLNKTFGELIYFMYNKNPYSKKVKDPLSWYRRFPINITEEEAKVIREQTIETAKITKIARDQRNPELAPHIAYDPIQNHQCKYCPHQYACQLMRNLEQPYQKEEIKTTLRTWKDDEYDF